ncbi:MAG: formyl transferase [Planctomycetaceae bacterium]|nr:formyl transferase [Planctomycetaceae bacterium]
MKTVLICHADREIIRYGTAPWMDSFSNLAGIIEIEDRPGSRWKSVQREVRRIGWLRLLDVVAFRLYYKLFLAEQDTIWAEQRLEQLKQTYSPLREDVPILRTHSPNSKASQEFLTSLEPDIIYAACKHILKPRIFSIAKTGTLVIHPGICPQYRNAHGCFWALASNDLDHVGGTLLQVDAGIDTGPVYKYLRAEFDEVHESHIVIQQRMMYDNLDTLAQAFQDIHEGRLLDLNTKGQPSREWGQPWLTAYLRWKRQARKRAMQQTRASEPQPRRRPVSSTRTATNSEAPMIDQITGNPRLPT